MKCNWCGKGKGRNRTTDKKTGKVMYYYCSNCIGFINKEIEEKLKYPINILIKTGKLELV